MYFGKNIGCWEKIDGWKCIYCGEYAESEDHFPPKSVCNKGFLLPACKECNVIASNDSPFDFEERVLLLRKRLKIKYSKILKMPDWEEYEIHELGSIANLPSSIREKIKQRDTIRKRLEWDWKAYLAYLKIDNFNEIIETMKEEIEEYNRLYREALIRALENSISNDIIKNILEITTN